MRTAQSKSALRPAPLLFACLALWSCAGNRSSLFLNPEFHFNSVETVAVIPFENLSDDQGAGMRVTRLFIGELLSKKAFDVVEPGEVSKALGKYSLVRTADLQKAQMMELGKTLGVQALFFGSVSESGLVRSSGSDGNEVTLMARMVETERGTTIWSATYTEGGRNLFQAMLGLEPASKSRVTMGCVKGIIRSLIK